MASTTAMRAIEATFRIQTMLRAVHMIGNEAYFFFPAVTLAVRQTHIRLSQTNFSIAVLPRSILLLAWETATGPDKDYLLRLDASLLYTL